MVSWTSRIRFANASSDHTGLLVPGTRAKFAAACCLALALFAASCGDDTPPTDQPTDAEPPAIEAPSQTADVAPTPPGNADAVAAADVATETAQVDGDADDPRLEQPIETPSDLGPDPNDDSRFTPLPAVDRRLLHTATLLEDGTVLLVGGASFNELNPNVERFDPADQSMQLAAPLLELRQMHSATLLSDGRVFVIGGVTTSGRIASTEIYDPVADAFVPGPPLPRARSALSSVRLADGRVLVTGGNREDPPTQVLEVYDPALNRFLDAGTLPDEMGGVRLVRLADDRVFAVSPTLAAIIDPVTFALDLLTPANGLLLEGFADAELAWPQVPTLLADGTVLLAGGCCKDGLAFAHAAVFDPGRRVLSSVGPLAVARAGAQTALLCDGGVLIVGGFTIAIPGSGGFTPTDSVELFDPVSQTFSAIEPMSIPRRWHTVTTLPNGDVLVVGRSLETDPDPPAAELFRTGCS